MQLKCLRNLVLVKLDSKITHIITFNSSQSIAQNMFCTSSIRITPHNFMRDSMLILEQTKYCIECQLQIIQFKSL